MTTAHGISAWMMPAKLESRVGGEVEFQMGPDEKAYGEVTAFEPERRLAYAEDWASLVGQPDAPVTPLVTEFMRRSPPSSWRRSPRPCSSRS